MLSHLELMEYHVNVLFKHDTEQRLLVVNEPPYEMAPQIFIGATQFGNLVRYSNSLDEAILEKVKHVLDTNPANLGEVIKILSSAGLFHHVSFGPAYVFPDVSKRTFTKVIKVTEENKLLLKPHFPYTYEDFNFKQPCFVIVENNTVVSICCSARQTSKAAEASVFTHKDYRGKDYGVEVTNAWAFEIQKQGRMALYSTTWDNFASQSLARKLQLLQYGTDVYLS